MLTTFSRAGVRYSTSSPGAFCREAYPSPARSPDVERASCPSRASRSIGSRSQTVSSPATKSITLGESTKKPPLITAPSPAGFSRKLATLVTCQLKRAEAAGRCNRSHRGQPAMRLVKLVQLVDVYVGHAVTIGRKKSSSPR